MESVSRIDLHMHSRFSDGAGDWLIRQIGARESYTTPRQAYDLAKHRGMDFVTLTDHDTIDGALEIAHLPGAFIGEEITTYFPEDGVKMHVVALDITETHHREISQLRHNIYELAGYLTHEGVVHFLAHPFYRMAAPLTLAHFEKCLLLFKVFEARNGGKEQRPARLVERVLAELSPARLALLADKHDLRPLGPTPWKKSIVAGSDDHGGLLIGTPHTVTPHAPDIQALLGHIRDGRSRPEGHEGSPLAVAHSILGVSYHYLRERESRSEQQPGLGQKTAWNLLGQLFEATNLDRSLSFSARTLLYLNHYVGLSKGVGIAGQPLLRQAAELLRQDKDVEHFLRCGMRFSEVNQEKLFDTVRTLVDRTLAEVLEALPSDGQNPGIGEMLKTLKPLLFLAIPYLIGFKTEYRDRPLMRKVADRYLDEGPRREEVLVFTDGDYRRVQNAPSLRRFLGYERKRQAHIGLFGMGEAGEEGGHRNFPVLASKHAGGVEFRLPSLLSILKAVSQKDVHKIYIHSHGVMALMGLLVGRWLGIPVHARYPYQAMVRWFGHGRQEGTGQLKGQLLQLLLSQVDYIRVDRDGALDHAKVMGVAPHRIIHVFPRSSGAGRLRPEDVLAGESRPIVESLS